MDCPKCGKEDLDYEEVIGYSSICGGWREPEPMFIYRCKDCKVMMFYCGATYCDPDAIALEIK